MQIHKSLLVKKAGHRAQSRCLQRCVSIRKLGSRCTFDTLRCSVHRSTTEGHIGAAEPKHPLLSPELPFRQATSFFCSILCPVRIVEYGLHCLAGHRCSADSCSFISGTGTGGISASHCLAGRLCFRGNRSRHKIHTLLQNCIIATSCRIGEQGIRCNDE